MKRRIVTSIDQRFSVDPDDFYKALGLSKGMDLAGEIVMHLQRMAINPTGYSLIFAEENRMPDAPKSRKCFVYGEEANDHFRQAFESAKLVACKIIPSSRDFCPASVSINCCFRRDKVEIAQFGCTFAEDGTEIVCGAGRYGYEVEAEETKSASGLTKSHQDPSGLWHFHTPGGHISQAVEQAMILRGQPAWFWFNGTPAAILRNDTPDTLTSR
jgi:hypothetical protein